MLDASALRITEFVASNDNSLEDFEGDSSDWLELYNPSTVEVDLEGLHLTDSSEELTQWSFPVGSTIAPGGFLVVFASGKDLVAPGGELHTSFKLSADGEYLGLINVDGQTVIDEFAPEFPSQVEDVAYGLAMESSPTTLVADGAMARAWRPTSGIYDATWTDIGFNDNVFNIVGPSGFGYEDSGGFPNFNGQFNTEVDSGTPSLYIRVPFQMTSLDGIDQLQLRMKYDDGFVAYINGVEVASANASATTNWQSTATTTHDDFDAIEYQTFDLPSVVSSLVVGENVLAIHALNRSAGSSDFLNVPELIATQSSIVSPEVLGFFDQPTPGFGNGENFAGFAEQPTMSLPHGFYTSPQQVELASETPDAVIVYTTDGSEPAVNDNLVPTNGQVYSNPINVSSTTTLRAMAFKQDFKPSFPQAATYLFLSDVVNQSASGEAPAGWPNNNVNGQVLDYGIDPEIVDLYGEQAVKDSLASLPTVSLTTDIANLFDASTGIYVNAQNRGREWERAASVEYINPDQSEGFSTNAGLRIRGGASRTDSNPKHAFRLYFRSEYGDGLLDYPLFGEEGTERFDVIDLRSPQNYSWANWGNSVNGQQNSFLREVFSRDTQADIDHPYTRSRYVHLYLNGQYWGVFMTQERIQEHFGESYFGGDQEDYDVVKSDPFESSGTEIADGTDVAWQQLFQQAQDLADNPVSSADNYWAMQGLNTDGTRNESLEVLLDVDNLIDYMMIIFYTGGHDTGISAFFGNQRANNWFGIRNRVTGDEGFQFFLHDNEHSLAAGEITGSLHGTFDIDRTGPFDGNLYDDFQFFNPAFLHQDLLVHPEYTQRFVDRVQALMFNDGPLTADQSIARMTERRDEVEPAIIAHAARWGDSKRSNPYTKADWEIETDWLLENYFADRGDLVIGQLLNDGLLNQLGAPLFSQLGGEVQAGFPLELSAAGGTIYYTLDAATDPRQIGGDVNPASEVQQYSGPIVLTEDTTVWARLLEPSGQWSGLVEATFTVPQLDGDYDLNGLVDEADFSLWQSSFGSTEDLSADGNGNNIVDVADFAVWRDGFAQQPTVVTPAAASPASVSGTATNLSVLGGMETGEANLTYTWSVTGPAEVVFSSNGDNLAKSTAATFSAAGEYTFAVTIENPITEAIATSFVSVLVEQSVAGVAISPADAFVNTDNSLQLTAFEIDQFGAPISVATGASWSVVSGGGSVSSTGLYTAPANAGTATVRVQASAGTADLIVEIVAATTWYKADATSGTVLTDSAGGSAGTVVGSAGWAAGINGNALSLTGGHAELPSGIVSGLDDITIATWFNLDNLGTWSRVFDFGVGPTANMFLTPQAASPGGPLRFAITTSGGGGEQQLNGPSLATGQWYHVAITLSGNTGTMYLNGVAVATNASMTLNPSDMGFTSQNYLGDSQYGGDPPLFGRIDDFRIYSEALPAEQILNLAHSTVAVNAQQYAFAWLADEAEAESPPTATTLTTATTFAAASSDDLLLLQLARAAASHSEQDPPRDILEPDSAEDLLLDLVFDLES